ncbi:MAG: hypothetical protein HEEMFOPI_00511 [Holosporales bacterium]
MTEPPVVAEPLEAKVQVVMEGIGESDPRAGVSTVPETVLAQVSKPPPRISEGSAVAKKKDGTVPILKAAAASAPAPAPALKKISALKGGRL